MIVETTDAFPFAASIEKIIRLLIRLSIKNISVPIRNEKTIITLSINDIVLKHSERIKVFSEIFWNFIIAWFPPTIFLLL